MTIITAAGAIGLLLGILSIRKKSIWTKIVVPPIAGVVGLLAGLGVEAGIIANTPTVLISEGPVPIVSIRTDRVFSNPYGAGVGNLAEKRTFQFFYKNDKGGLTPGAVEANDKVSIVEEDVLKDSGYISYIYEVSDPSAPLTAWLHTKVRRLKSVEIHVPADTVYKEWMAR